MIHYREKWSDSRPTVGIGGKRLGPMVEYFPELPILVSPRDDLRKWDLKRDSLEQEVVTVTVTSRPNSSGQTNQPNKEGRKEEQPNKIST